MIDGKNIEPALGITLRTDRRGSTVEEQDGYSGMFYIMLIVGIIGVLGFVVVAAGAGS